MRLAQIIDNKAHWIFDPVELFGTADISDRFPPDLLFVEVSEEVNEGDIYDAESEIFFTPPPDEPGEAEEEQLDIEISEADLFNASILLNQQEILINQKAQDETLAAILLAGVSDNV